MTSLASGRRARLFAILALAVLARGLDYSSIASPAGLCLAGGPDAYYQLRRAELAAAGTLSSQDAWTNFPDGDQVHWPLAYAHLLGGALRGVGAVGLLLVPVLGALAALALFSFHARRLEPDSAEYSTLVFAIVPAAVFPTVLGAIDHHCLEGLFFIGAITAAGSGDGGSRMAVLSRGALGIGIGALGAAFITAWPVACVAAAATAGLRLIRNPLGGGFVLLVAALIVPMAGWSYFATPWFSEIEEAQPLIRGVTDIFKAMVMLSPGFILFPIAIAAWWRRRDAAAAALAATAVALPLALLQTRFLVILAVPAALAMGTAASLARGRYGWRPAVFIALVSLLPVGRGLSEIPQWKPDPLPDVHNAYIFLRDKTPSAGDYLDPASRPRYGVAAAWDLGHHILALGMRPAVANAFHTGATGRDSTHLILLSDAATATALADSIGVRYLFLTNLSIDGYARNHRKADQPPVMESLYGRLYLRGEPRLGWRLVYASHHGILFEGTHVPWVQIWERATLLNGAAPL
jgi:asparagine N-glycosylation enzyme membrane subunit Stt3